MNRIEQIRAREQAATPGEWAITGAKSHLIDSKPEEKYGAVSIVCEVWNNIDANAAFIAHARQDIPYLLSEVDRLTAELQEWKDKYSLDIQEVNARADMVCWVNDELTAELEQYRNHESAGLLVKLPCKVGDILYEPYSGNIDSGKIHHINIEIESDIGIFEPCQINQTVFLTRKEAESYQEK